MAKRRKINRKKQEAKKSQAPPENVEKIQCELIERSQFAGLLPDYEPDIKKRGTYHASVFHEVEEWGHKKWVVGTYIRVDYENLLKEGKTMEEIVAGCLAFLNQPPPRKKYQRRLKNPLYGNLDPMPLKWWRKELADCDGEKCIGVLLVTDKRKCRHFWGEGQKL